MKILAFLFIILFSLSCNTFAHKDPWDANKSDWTPLMKAIYHEKVRIIDRIINKADSDYLNFKSSKGMSAISIAIRLRDSITVKKLLSTDSIKVNQDLIYWACVYDCYQNVVLLYDYGFQIFEEDKYSKAFNMACKNGNSLIVEFFLSNGANVNQQRSINDYTPLITATMNANIEVVEILLNNGANKKIKLNYNGKMAIDYVNKKLLLTKISEKELIKLRILLIDK